MRRLVAAGCALELLLLTFYLVGPSPAEVLVFIAVHALMFACAWWVADRCDVRGKRAMTVIIGFALLFRVTLLLHAPVHSDDIYRYLWDGRVAAHGINPFRYAPDDATLAPLHTDELPARVSFAEMRTIYPPLAQGVFALSALAFGDSLAGLKLVVVVFDMASIGLLLALLKAFAVRRSALVLYAWSPLPVLYFALDGHVDAVGIPFLLLAILLAVRSRRLAASVALAGAVLAKLHPLMLSPLLIRLAPGWRGLVYAAIPAAALVAASLPFLEPTGGLTESLVVYSSTWEFNGSVFSLVNGLIAPGAAAHVICAGALLVWLALLVAIDRPFPEKLFLALLGFFLLGPTIHPWYLTWLAVLVPLRRSVAVTAFLFLSVVSAVVVYRYRLTGVWQEEPWLLLLEYVPVYLLLVIELLRGEFTRAESLRRFPLTVRPGLSVQS